MRLLNGNFVFDCKKCCFRWDNQYTSQCTACKQVGTTAPTPRQLASKTVLDGTLQAVFEKRTGECDACHTLTVIAANEATAFLEESLEGWAHPRTASVGQPCQACNKAVDTVCESRIAEHVGGRWCFPCFTTVKSEHLAVLARTGEQKDQLRKERESDKRQAKRASIRAAEEAEIAKTTVCSLCPAARSGRCHGCRRVLCSGHSTVERHDEKQRAFCRFCWHTNHRRKRTYNTCRTCKLPGESVIRRGVSKFTFRCDTCNVARVALPNSLVGGCGLS